MRPSKAAQILHFALAAILVVAVIKNSHAQSKLTNRSSIHGCFRRGSSGHLVSFNHRPVTRRLSLLDATYDATNEVADVDQSVTIPVMNYTVKCIIPRGNTLRYNPTLFLYSSETYTPEVFGCKETTKIVLATGDIGGVGGGEQKLVITDNMIASLHSGGYNSQWPTYILTHGFMANWNRYDWMCRIKDLILTNSKANVFILDWSGGSMPTISIDYSASVANTKHVGGIVAAFIDSLLQMSGQADASNFHLIGHSLGAHLFGYVGYSVKNLGRITALDPAGPCFTTNTPKQAVRARETGHLANNRRRLSPASAKLVVALHTDTSLFGLSENCAHYDVYVNGGYKQPKCCTLSLTKRFYDLVNFNMDEFFNTEVYCAHSFACNLLDSFVSFFEKNDRVVMTRGLFKKSSPNSSHINNDKCHHVAYRCDDWNTFKSGECGFCLDGDTSCVYIGLRGKTTPTSRFNVDSKFDSTTIQRLQSFNYTQEDDLKFNDEEEQSSDDDPKHPAGANEQALYMPPNENSFGHHFIRIDADGPTCQYHYQIVVATKKSLLAELDVKDKIHYYLHIPLEDSGLLSGGHLSYRLVQISHKVEHNSFAYKLLTKRYIPTISKRMADNISLQTDDIQFFTALITFAQAPSSSQQCNGGDQDGFSESGKWQLCGLLDSIREARLWASSSEKLAAIEWVSMNYMSGLTYDERIRGSYVFGRNETVIERHQIDKFDLVLIQYLESKIKRTPLSPVGEIRQKLGCFLQGRTRTVNKCSRISRQLNFAINLKPMKL